MAFDPKPEEPRGGTPSKGFGVVGLFIVGVVVVLALLVTLLGPTETQQADNGPESPSSKSQSSSAVVP